jgi:hypothetical protein
VECLELRVLHPPPAVQLLDDEERIEEEPDLPCAELGGEGERADDRRVLGDVVRLNPEVVRDRGVRRRTRVERIGAIEVDEDRPGRSMAGVRARRAVGADDEAPSGRPRRAGPGAGPFRWIGRRGGRTLGRRLDRSIASRQDKRNSTPAAEADPPAGQLPPGPTGAGRSDIGDPLSEQDDRVIGDLDVLGADLGAALRDVAVAESASSLRVRPAVGWSAGWSSRPATRTVASRGPRNGALCLVVAEDVARRLAEKHSMHFRYSWTRSMSSCCQRQSSTGVSRARLNGSIVRVHLVVPRHVGDGVADEGKERIGSTVISSARS